MYFRDIIAEGHHTLENIQSKEDISVAEVSNKYIGK